ncbi:hypothetical protein SAMN02910358_01338 [Lachnospiraceae bacterium XBB1006]|nr:hypothetical protein SAMN02910358_01338 [Lachnospiraceae bacterium XBB1006]
MREMRDVFVLRTLSWLCLASAIFMPYRGMKKEISYLLVEFGLCILVAVLAYKVRTVGKLRYPISVIPLLSVATTHNISMWLLSFIMVGYFVYVAISEQYDTILWKYQREFVRGLAVAGLVAISYMIVVNFYMRQDSYVQYAFLLFYVILGSFILRQLRLGNFQSRQVKILNMLMLLGTCFLAVILTGGIRIAGILNWDAIVNVVLMPIGLVLEFFSYIVVLVTKKPAHFLWKHHMKAEKISKNVKPPKQWGARRFQEAAKQIENDDIYGYAMGSVLIVIMLIIIAVLLFFLIRYIRDHQFPSYYEDAEEIFETEDGRYYEKRKEKARGAKRKLRNYYRKYLLYSKKMGTQIVQSDTSEDVMKKNEVVAGMRPSENELRTLYAKTRYVDGYEPTNDEVRRAKELMKSLNKNDNWV